MSHIHSKKYENFESISLSADTIFSGSTDLSDLFGSGGSGIANLTQNFIPKANSSGDNILDSRIIDNGTQIGIGTGYTLSRDGEIVTANGNISSDGDAQDSQAIFRGQTTDATQTEIFLDGSSARATIGTNRLVGFEVFVTGLQTGGGAGTAGDSWIHIINGAIKNIGGTTSLIGSLIDTLIAEDSGTNSWSVSVDADNTNNSIRVRVTGEASKNINWKASIRMKEIAY